MLMWVIAFKYYSNALVFLKLFQSRPGLDGCHRKPMDQWDSGPDELFFYPSPCPICFGNRRFQICGLSWNSFFPLSLWYRRKWRYGRYVRCYHQGRMSNTYVWFDFSRWQNIPSSSISFVIHILKIVGIFLNALDVIPIQTYRMIAWLVSLLVTSIWMFPCHIGSDYYHDVLVTWDEAVQNCNQEDGYITPIGSIMRLERLVLFFIPSIR